MKKKLLHIDENVLRKLYVVDGLSMLKIAQYFNCSQDTIARRLKALDIERRSVKKEIPIDEVMEMYLVEGKTIKEISRHFQCSHTTIGNRLHSLGIRKEEVKKESQYSEEAIVRAYKSGNSATFIAKKTGLSRWAVLNILRKHKLVIRKSYKRKRLPKEHLEYLYQDRRMTTMEIANLYNVKPCTVSLRLKEEGLAVRGNRLDVPLVKIVRYYIENNRSVSRTARHFKCAYTTIRNKLVEAGELKRARIH